jgi:hypothetical protein
MELVAYVCSHVFENTRPIVLVSKEGGIGNVYVADNMRWVKYHMLLG